MSSLRIILIGGNPKGYDKPFSENTLSGRRLRKILLDNHINAEIYDMTKNIDDKPSYSEIQELKQKVVGFDHVFFLGRFVERN